MFTLLILRLLILPQLKPQFTESKSGGLNEHSAMLAPNIGLESMFSTQFYESHQDSARRSLLTAMPSHKDIVTIVTATETWWTIWFDKSQTPSANFDVSSIMNLCFSNLATRSTSFIGRALLLISASLQQLSHDYDYTRLSLPLSPQDLIEQYSFMVSTLVTSNDELVGNADGLECLTLQGLNYCNAGKPRRALLSFRRALDVAQLLGLHRGVWLPNKNAATEPTKRLSDVWWTIFEADRFIPLVLGLPYGIANKDCDLEVRNLEGSDVSYEEVHTRKISIINADVIDRNQASKVPGYEATQEINEKLERLAKEMPQSWWDIPTTGWPTDSPSLARLYTRVMAQFWHYEIEALLHLPFMLRSVTESRYNNNKHICLKASRKMVSHYFILRENFAPGFVCKLTDFQVFTGAVILVLHLIGAASLKDDVQQEQQNAQDWQIVDKMIMFLSDPKASIDNSVATQGLKILQTLAVIGRADKRCSGSLKLAIPYFGTIAIARGSKVQDATIIQADGQQPNWQPNSYDKEIQPMSPISQSDVLNHGQQYPSQWQPLEDPYHIDFALNSVFPITGESEALVPEDFTIPEDEMEAFESMFEFDQKVGENWNFSMEGAAAYG